MADRFDFEQQIMECWKITDEIKTVAEGITEDDLSTEQVSTIIHGLAGLYEMKFNKLWDCFEQVHMGLVRDNAMITGECNALRQQLLEATDVPFIKASNTKKGNK
tara:strand:+ start:284 stop:598 length:315 start_codon:yes stop_codon:yes gene_type:complete